MSGNFEANPYVGPRAFVRGEQLHGRDAEISRLFHLFRARRIVVLHSPSGAGKSSLIQAGLVPRLEREKFDVWRTIRVNLDPEGHEGVPVGTNRYVLSAMVSLEEELPEAHRRSPAQLAGLDLATYLDTRPRRKQRKTRPVVLIFDQFEEVLTKDPLAREAKRAFFRELGSVLESSKYWALFGIREDFLAAFSPYRDYLPTQMSNTFRLDLLGLEGAREAAEKPALRGGRSFPGVDQLIRDLATVRVQQPDGSFVACEGLHVEPVQLQVVCQRLWNAMPDDDPSIDPEDIERYAGVSASLADYYAQAVDTAAGGDVTVERAIRDWVGHKLIVGAIRSQVRQEAEQSAGLDNALIERLRSSYLVRAEQRAGSTWFELSHDRLVQPVMRDNEAWERAHLHPVQVQAKLWENGRRSPGLLLSAEALPEAETWASDNDAAVTEHEREFLLLSRQHRNREATARRRSRILIAVTSALGLVMAVGTIYMNELRDQAQADRDEAEAAKDFAQGAMKQLEHNEEVMRASLSDQLGRQAQLLIPDNREGEALRLAIQAVGAYTQLDEPPPAAAREGLERVLMDDAIVIDEGIVLDGHEGAVSAVVWSPRGDRLATASHDGTAIIWDSAGTRVATLDNGHTKPINALAYSDTGEFIATASDDKSTIIWNADGSRHRTLVSRQRVTDVAFSPLSPLQFATAHWGGMFRIGTTDSDEWQFEVEGHDKLLQALVFAPDGTHLATASKDGAAKIWNATDGVQTAGPLEHEDYVLALAYSPEGATLATGSKDKSAHIWDASSGALLHTLVGHDDWVYALAYSSDGSMLATGSYDETIRVWDAKTGALLMTLEGHESGVRDLEFSPKQGVHLLVSASKDTTLRLWDVDNRRLDRTFIGHDNETWKVAFSPDGSRLASASKDQSARIWELSTQAEFSVQRGHSGPIRSVSYSPEGARITTASQDMSARVWDPKNAQQLESFEIHESEQLAFGGGSAAPRLAAASKEGEIHIYDATTGQSLEILDREGIDMPVVALTYSRDGSQLATGCGDYKARVWDPNTGALVAELDHGGSVYALAYSPDGKQLATGSYDTKVRIWDLGSESPAVLADHNNVVYGLAYSVDGQQLASASSDRTVKIWDPASHELLKTLRGHTNEVWVVAYSPDPDGSRLVSAGKDGRARLWNTANWELVAKLEHGAPINDVTFSPDGTTLVTVGDDHTAKIWSAETGELQVVLDDELQGALEWPDLTRIACERLRSVELFADDYEQVRDICD